MQSIRKRLNGNLPEFLEDVKTLGKWGAMEKWGLEKSYLAVMRIITEETGDENFGINPSARSYLGGGIQGLLRELVSAFADYVIHTEIKNRELRAQLDAYRAESEKGERQVVDGVVSLIEALKSS
jgi:protoporphyrinogen oxidase